MNSILGQYMVSDAREAGRNLLASLESIEEMEIEEEKKADAVEEASTLALRIGRDFPENSEMHGSMFKVLEGLGATEGMNVSNEGLLGAVAKLSGFWRKPKPDAKQIPAEDKSTWSQRDGAIREFVKEMEKTYLNSSWVGKQKFVEGTVPAKDFSGAFQLDGKPVTDPLASIEQHKKNMASFVDKWSGVLRGLNDQVQTIHKRTVAATKGAAEDDQSAVDLVKKATAEFDALPDPTAKLPTYPGTGFANKVPYVDEKFKTPCVRVKVKMETTPSDTLPALDKEGVIKVAQVIKKIVSDPEFFPYMDWISWLDFKDGSTFVDWIYDADNNAYEDYYWRFYWQGPHDIWMSDIYALNNYYNVITGLIKWIDRSIK